MVGSVLAVATQLPRRGAGPPPVVPGGGEPARWPEFERQFAEHMAREPAL